MKLPKEVKIIEVGPRDGLQNEKKQISTDIKLELIRRLESSGLKHIEATAFVSPKWVPQMSDAKEVMEQLTPQEGISYPVLVPNLQGFQAALKTGVREVAVFTAASESFSQKNINCSIQESLTRFEPILEMAAQHHIKVRGYISCVLGCPYEGPISPSQVASVAERLFDLGCYEISLGDTIGVGTPLATIKMIESVASKIPLSQLAGHFHDTYGMAIANIFAALQVGMSTFDSSIAGLGGCPYAKGASGNVSTEDVIYLLNGLGIKSGVNLTSLLETSHWIKDIINSSPTLH